MAEILIGTSGYSYHEWVGPVYPEGTKQKDYLPCYAGLFPTVELNFSYYKMPEAKNLSKMLIDGGPNLTFAIKAHQTLTHKIDSNNWEENAKTYLTAIEPMLEAKRLEAVLFQFPYSFQYSDDNRRYLDKLLKYFKGVPAAAKDLMAQSPAPDIAVKGTTRLRDIIKCYLYFLTNTKNISIILFIFRI